MSFYYVNNIMLLSHEVMKREFFSLIGVPVFTLHSDMTTLTSATYQPNMAIHSGQHLLSMQGRSLSPKEV